MGWGGAPGPPLQRRKVCGPEGQFRWQPCPDQLSSGMEVFEPRTFEFSVKASWGQAAGQDEGAGPETRAVAGRGHPAPTLDGWTEDTGQSLWTTVGGSRALPSASCEAPRALVCFLFGRNRFRAGRLEGGRDAWVQGARGREPLPVCLLSRGPWRLPCLRGRRRSSPGEPHTYAGVQDWPSSCSKGGSLRVWPEAGRFPGDPGGPDSPGSD